MSRTDTTNSRNKVSGHAVCLLVYTYILPRTDRRRNFGPSTGWDTRTFLSKYERKAFRDICIKKARRVYDDWKRTVHLTSTEIPFSEPPGDFPTHLIQCIWIMYYLIRKYPQQMS